MELLPRVPGSRFEPLEELVAYSGGRVRFAAHPGEFGVDIRACGNPACGCEDATLVFAELTGRREDALVFAVHARLRDATTVPERSQVPAAAAPLVSEVLRDLVPAVRAGLLDRLRAFRQQRPSVGGLRLAPDWLEGDASLLPLSHILAGGRPEDPQYRGYLDRPTIDGAEWLVQDMYCPRPRCDCREVLLDFQRLPTTDHAEAVFGARVRLGTLELAIEQPVDIGLREARAVVGAWLRASPRGDRHVLGARYEALRELAAHPLSEPLGARILAPRMPGGKEPCPCGSGKKFKRCCGALEN